MHFLSEAILEVFTIQKVLDIIKISISIFSLSFLSISSANSTLLVIFCSSIYETFSTSNDGPYPNNNTIFNKKSSQFRGKEIESVEKRDPLRCDRTKHLKDFVRTFQYPLELSITSIGILFQWKFLFRKTVVIIQLDITLEKF